MTASAVSVSKAMSPAGASTEAAVLISWEAGWSWNVTRGDAGGAALGVGWVAGAAAPGAAVEAGAGAAGPGVLCLRLQRVVVVGAHAWREVMRSACR